MAEDREILREVWDGRVPVCVQLASEDCSTLSAPDPYYLMIPRLSYFPLVMDKVRKHFLRFTAQELQDAEMWLESDGTPLKWHYPVGVLFDLQCGGSALPWCLTAHFSHFPEQDLIRCQTREVVESHFMSSLKEADGLKHRGQIITNMQGKDHKQLWMGLCNGLSNLWKWGDRVVIQGIEAPQDTPLQWLSEHLSHPDNFLHICYITAQT
ncbi:hypothetical protein OTU49_003420 [Cherax quadricarinatus]|uniref:Autophagy protein 5 n=1 Tax=Cherax quadricarinatus TaxID=27406 RepID=A0AAW0XIU3_CHEQU